MPAGLAMQAAHQQSASIPAYLICDARALRQYGIGMVRPGASAGLLKTFLDEVFKRDIGYLLLRRGDTDLLFRVLPVPIVHVGLCLVDQLLIVRGDALGPVVRHLFGGDLGQPHVLRLAEPRLTGLRQRLRVEADGLERALGRWWPS